MCVQSRVTCTPKWPLLGSTSKMPLNSWSSCFYDYGGAVVKGMHFMSAPAMLAIKLTTWASCRPIEYNLA